MSGHSVNGVPLHFSDPRRYYHGISAKQPTWFSAQGGVYRCREAGGARQNVAIKKYLVVERDNDPETFVMPKELVENEIYTMTKCAPHPNILRLHGVHIYKDYIFLVMPLCDGGSLQQYCFDNRVSLSQMVFILKGVSIVLRPPRESHATVSPIIRLIAFPLFIPPHKLPQLVSGLAEIHKHGYIHRDIKCDNIFLGQDNTIVIGNFFLPIYIKQKIIKQGRPHYPRNMDRLLVDFIDRCLERDPRGRASANELLEKSAADVWILIHSVLFACLPIQHPLLSAYAEEPLFPPRPREQPFPLPAALTTKPPQTPAPIIPSVDIKDINRTLVSPVVETPNKLNVFKERRDSETSLSSSATLLEWLSSSTDKSSADAKLNSAVHAFATSLSTIAEVSISSNASTVSPKDWSPQPRHKAYKRRFGKVPSPSKALAEQGPDRYLHRVVQNPSLRPEATLSSPLLTRRRRLQRAMLWTMASKSEDSYRLGSVRRLFAFKLARIQQAHEAQNTDIALRNALRNADARITSSSASSCARKHSQNTDIFDMRASLSSSSSSSAPFEIASIQIEEELLKCSIRSDDIRLIDEPLLPIVPHLSITPERSSLMRTPKRMPESRLPRASPLLRGTDPLAIPPRDKAAKKLQALAAANGPLSRLPVVKKKPEQEPEPVRRGRNMNVSRGPDAPDSPKMGRPVSVPANINRASPPKSPKVLATTPPLAPVRSKPSKTEPARNMITKSQGKPGHQRRGSAPDYGVDTATLARKSTRDRALSLASSFGSSTVPNARLASSIGSQGGVAIVPRTPGGKSSKKFDGRASMGAAESRRSSLESKGWGYNSVGSARARTPTKKFDGRASTNSVEAATAVALKRRSTVTDPKWGHSSVGSQRAASPVTKKFDGRASMHAEKKVDTRASKHVEKKWDGRASTHADKKWDGRASTNVEKKFDGRASTRDEKRFDGRASTHVEKKFDGRASTRDEKRFDGRASTHVEKKFDGRASTRDEKRFDGRASTHVEKKFDGRASTRDEKRFDGRASTHAEKKWDGRASTHSEVGWGFSSVGSNPRKKTGTTTAKDTTATPNSPTRNRRSSMAAGTTKTVPPPRPKSMVNTIDRHDEPSRNRRRTTDLSMTSDGGAYSGDDEDNCAGGDGGTDGGDSGSISEGTRKLTMIAENENVNNRGYTPATAPRSTSFHTGTRKRSSTQSAIAPSASITSSRRQVRMDVNATAMTTSTKDRRKSYDVNMLSTATTTPLRSALRTARDSAPPTSSPTSAKQRPRAMTASGVKTVVVKGESVMTARTRDGSAAALIMPTSSSTTPMPRTHKSVAPKIPQVPQYKKSPIPSVTNAARKAALSLSPVMRPRRVAA
ncbi:hypothetical protein BC938DRAFT_473417 [Jimgerdemannia flammicorona]|uniref:Protein kinase domain-containing protein n=1 Tax=Jimgerdemannia flammicorona TaxID=994334 RepID=A0A433Q3Z3_9FUNG|nr:hypothetical protein BC938DRAFT_473417 [Jimgerdemannia flammicorona]